MFVQVWVKWKPIAMRAESLVLQSLTYQVMSGGHQKSTPSGSRPARSIKPGNPQHITPLGNAAGRTRGSDCNTWQKEAQGGSEEWKREYICIGRPRRETKGQRRHESDGAQELQGEGGLGTWDWWSTGTWVTEATHSRCAAHSSRIWRSWRLRN